MKRFCEREGNHLQPSLVVSIVSNENLLVSTMSVKPVLLHFKFDNFASLQTRVGTSVLTETQIDYNGNRWYLELYNVGPRRSTTNDGDISLYLHS